jgi:hypothetical protein
VRALTQRRELAAIGGVALASGFFLAFDCGLASAQQICSNSQQSVSLKCPIIPTTGYINGGSVTPWMEPGWPGEEEDNDFKDPPIPPPPDASPIIIPWGHGEGATLGGPVGPVRVSLYGLDGASGPYTGFDASGSRSSGYRVTDTAGTIAPGSLAPGFHSSNYGGGVKVTADGASLFDLNANQRLLFGLSGDYHYNSTTYGTSALTPGVANAASVQPRRPFGSAAGFDPKRPS